MIACHDLRTGNIVLVNNRLRRIVMISNSETLTDQSMVAVESTNNEGNETYSFQDIQPVPMNEAILEQCHFIYQQHLKFWQFINTDGIRTEMNIDDDYNLIDFMRKPIVKKISSLHQLQNIYYMLFNKELDFDLDTTIIVDGIVRHTPSLN